MFTLPLLSLLLATSALASPVRRDWNVTSTQVPVNTTWFPGQPLPQPLTPLESTNIIDIALAVGEQTYTCDSNGQYGVVPTAVVAELININIVIETENFSNIQNIAYNSLTSTSWNYTQFLQQWNLTTFGQMNATQDSNGVLIPIWTNTTNSGWYTNSSNASISGQVVNTAPSSSGTNWVEFAVESEVINTVYMVNTVGGQSPSTPCTPGSTEAVDFVAVILFIEVNN